MPTSITKHPPGSRCAATLRKHATCSSCVVRFVDRVEHEVGEPRRCRPPGWSRSRRSSRRCRRYPVSPRSRSTMAGERSMPCTRTPRRLSGSAMRPVPMPSSSAAPLPASSARKSTAGSTTAGSNMSAESRRSALRSVRRSRSPARAHASTTCRRAAADFAELGSAGQRLLQDRTRCRRPLVQSVQRVFGSKRGVLAAAVAATAVLVFTSPAAAHVTVNPS